MSMRDRIHVALALALASALASAGCGDNRPTGPEALRVDPAAQAVPAGRALTLAAVYEADGATFPAGDEVAWTSSNLLVATVTAGDGGTAVVRGVASGPAAITARAGGLESAAAIFVGPAVPAALALVPPSATMRSGDCMVVVAHLTRSDGTIAILDGGPPLQWSGVTGVLQVGDDGTICANQPGTDTVSARLGDLIATTDVEVTPAALSFISLKSGGDVIVGQTGGVLATAFYQDGSQLDLHGLATFASSDPSIATISSPDGIITGIAPGTLHVSATFEDQTGWCPIVVVLPALLRVVVTPTAPGLTVGGSVALTATGFFVDGTQRDVTAQATWLSGSPTVATVSSSGVVTAIAPGASVVSARYQVRTGAVFVTVAD